MDSSSEDVNATQSELHFLNDCLSDALSVHLLLCHSMRCTAHSEAPNDRVVHCTLLDEDVQEYLRQLLNKYSGSAAMRKKLRSGRCLYYLQCLTDAGTRNEFIQVASHPSFPRTIENISYDGERVQFVEIRLPSRHSARGELKTIQACERIGQGSFGTVYRAVCEGYPRLAVKISTGNGTRLRQELEVLSKVCTKGKLLLPRFEFGAINKAADLIIIGMELCVPCTLHDLLLSTRLTSESDMLFIAYQVIQAVACVHEQKCIHRDVKLQNFVFDLDGNLKLIDFGLASAVWSPPPGDVVAGTVSFMAPEMAHNALHRDQRVSVGPAADVWSAGIVLFSIFTQRNPYPPSIDPSETVGSRGRHSHNPTGEEEEEDEEEEARGGAAAAPMPSGIPRENAKLLRRVAAADWRWPVGCSVSNELRQLVDFILVRNPDKRPSIISILSKPIWNTRRRAPPVAVTAFLGVQDDFLLSRDEAHLLRAVEQRSADVTASLMTSRANTPERDEEAEEPAPDTAALAEETREKEWEATRASLRLVAREEAAVGGGQTAQLYDVRGGARGRRPLREISQVIADETAKSLRRGQSRSRRGREGTASHSRQNSRPHSRAISPAPPAPAAKRSRAESGSRATSALRRAPLAKCARPDNALPVSQVMEELNELVQRETAERALLAGAVLLEQEWLLCSFRLVIEEDQERYHAIWLEEEQRRSAAHPHHFKEMTQVAKKYALGFVCDMCDYEFLPTGKWLHFFHCTCGRDLCPECHASYKVQCKCTTCGKEQPNSVAIRDHLVGGKCKANANGSPKKGRQMTTPASRKSSTNAAAPQTTPPRPYLQRGKAKKVVETSPVAPLASPEKEPKLKRPRTRRSESHSATHVPSNTNPPATSTAALTKTASSSLFNRPINTMPEGPWKPFEKLSISQQQVRAVLPTVEERHVLLNGEWIRHFHLFPSSPEEGEPVAFAYHIQPGRTGAIFLTHNFPIHSAVMSVLERQMFLVDLVDTTEGEDATRAVSLLHAKSSPVLAGAFDVLQAIVAYDCNMVKQHRAPGQLSVYQAPRTAYRCHGDPFVYVRWFRFNEERSLSAFLLSNGAVQVFVGDEYELRWFDENRKFLLRSNGVCEVIDDATFALAPAVNHLLYDTF